MSGEKVDFFDCDARKKKLKPKFSEAVYNSPHTTHTHTHTTSQNKKKAAAVLDARKLRGSVGGSLFCYVAFLCKATHSASTK